MLVSIQGKFVQCGQEGFFRYGRPQKDFTKFMLWRSFSFW